MFEKLAKLYYISQETPLSNLFVQLKLCAVKVIEIKYNMLLHTVF